MEDLRLKLNTLSATQFTNRCPLFCGSFSLVFQSKTAAENMFKRNHLRLGQPILLLRFWCRGNHSLILVPFCRKAIGFFGKPCLSKSQRQLGASDNQSQQVTNISMKTVKSNHKVEVFPLHMGANSFRWLGAGLPATPYFSSASSGRRSACTSA